MAIYVGQDLKSDYSGDLIVNAKGDFEIGSSTNTYIDQISFILRTISQDFAASNYTLGANLHEFIGELVTENLYRDIEYRIISSLSKRLLKKNDLTVEVVPIDSDEILVYINVDGLFVDNNGRYESEILEAIFSFPIFEGDGIRLISFQSRSQ